MGRESKHYTVTIRVAATHEMNVSALSAKDAERVAHGLFTLEDVDAHRLVQETIGPIVECRGLDCGKGKSKPWVVVENAGMDDERFVDEFATFEIALKCKTKRPGADIMRRTTNHSLTSDY